MVLLGTWFVEVPEAIALSAEFAAAAAEEEEEKEEVGSIEVVTCVTAADSAPREEDTGGIVPITDAGTYPIGTAAPIFGFGLGFPLSSAPIKDTDVDVDFFLRDAASLGFEYDWPLALYSDEWAFGPKLSVIFRAARNGFLKPFFSGLSFANKCLNILVEGEK